jgi:hypothetical protein
VLGGPAVLPAPPVDEPELVARPRPERDRAHPGGGDRPRARATLAPLPEAPVEDH